MKELICIVCPRGCHLKVDEAADFAVTGNACPRGAEYARAELTHPTRVLTTTVWVDGGVHRRLPVKTNRAIPRERMFEAMRLVSTLRVDAPVHVGDVIVRDLLGTGADLVATRDMERLAR